MSKKASKVTSKRSYVRSGKFSKKSVDSKNDVAQEIEKALNQEYSALKPFVSERGLAYMTSGVACQDDSKSILNEAFILYLRSTFPTINPGAIRNPTPCGEPSQVVPFMYFEEFELVRLSIVAIADNGGPMMSLSYWEQRNDSVLVLTGLTGVKAEIVLGVPRNISK